MDLYMRFEVNIDHMTEYKLDTNIRKEKVLDMVWNCIEAQAGLGADDSPANEYDVYHIEVRVELHDDSFHIKSDTGNKGLTCGMLMTLAQIMTKEGVKTCEDPSNQGGA